MSTLEFQILISPSILCNWKLLKVSSCDSWVSYSGTAKRIREGNRTHRGKESEALAVPYGFAFLLGWPQARLCLSLHPPNKIMGSTPALQSNDSMNICIMCFWLCTMCKNLDGARDYAVIKSHSHHSPPTSPPSSLCNEYSCILSELMHVKAYNT